MRLYHGTTVRNSAKLWAEGTSSRLYVTAYRPLAIMYAIFRSAEEEGVPAVVVLRTLRPLEPDLEHAPIPSDKAYVLEGLRKAEIVTVQSEPEWLLLLAEYRKTGIIDEDVL